MTSTPRCRAQGGPGKCRDPRCPAKHGNRPLNAAVYDRESDRQVAADLAAFIGVDGTAVDELPRATPEAWAEMQAFFDNLPSEQAEDAQPAYKAPTIGTLNSIAKDLIANRAPDSRWEVMNKEIALADETNRSATVVIRDTQTGRYTQFYYTWSWADDEVQTVIDNGEVEPQLRNIRTWERKHEAAFPIDDQQTIATQMGDILSHRPNSRANYGLDIRHWEILESGDESDLVQVRFFDEESKLHFESTVLYHHSLQEAEFCDSLPSWQVDAKQEPVLGYYFVR